MFTPLCSTKARRARSSASRSAPRPWPDAPRPQEPCRSLLQSLSATWSTPRRPKPPLRYLTLAAERRRALRIDRAHALAYGNGVTLRPHRQAYVPPAAPRSPPTCPGPWRTGPIADSVPPGPGGVSQSPVQLLTQPAPEEGHRLRDPEVADHLGETLATRCQTHRGENGSRTSR